MANNTVKSLTASFPRETPWENTAFHVVCHTMTFPYLIHLVNWFMAKWKESDFNKYKHLFHF